MVARFVRLGTLTAALVLSVGIWPAHAKFTHGPVITAPSSGQVFSGELGNSASYTITIRAEATTDCGGFASPNGRIWVEDYESSFNYAKELPDTDANADAKVYRGSAPWSTESVRNGTYRAGFEIVERDCLLQREQSFSGRVSFKVANPPAIPEWQGAPEVAGDTVTLRWKPNPEEDIVEYRIERTGPGDATATATAAPSDCSEAVCTAQDALSGDYTGTYTYRVFAVRFAPAGTGEPCEASSSGRCIVSQQGSEPQSVSLTAPTPTPSPTDSPTSPGTPSGTPSERSSPAGAPRGSSRSTRVLSFGGGSSSDFYSGTYSETLPYQPRTLILGGGSATASPRARALGEIVSETPPDYRRIMLPVAGGLLAFLSAAHVRRLLLHL